MAGDLAFYAACVEKKNMSGKWYHWCNLSSKEWKAKGHTKGDAWTIDSLKDVVKDI